MTARRVVVHIDEVVIDAEHGADVASLEADVRAGIAAAFRAGTPQAFTRSASLLTTEHNDMNGVGAAIARATPPRRAS